MQPQDPVASNDPLWSGARSRTNPIPRTSRGVPGYPDKLRIYLTGASPFWQVRCFFRGKMHTRSLRTSDPKRAVRGAQAFYEELTARYLSTPDATQIRSPRSADLLFREAAHGLLESEQARVGRGEFSAGSMRVLEAQLANEVIPFFGDLALGEVGLPQIEKFLQKLSTRSLATMTIHHYLIALRKVLKHAVAHGQLVTVPAMPSIRITSAPRGGFGLAEYRQLVGAARRLVPRVRAASRSARKAIRLESSARRSRMSSDQVHSDLPQLIRFMVNSFVRPHDVKLLQHKHVQVVRGASTYLRLVLPKTKRKTAPVVTMSAAVHIYETLRTRAALLGRARPEDFVFLPEESDRSMAMWLMDRHFLRVLKSADLRMSHLGQRRTLYSLRHTAIMFRLLYGEGIDLLTLARNARTSVAMIEKFYASNLTAEMNIGMLQSRRINASAQ